MFLLSLIHIVGEKKHPHRPDLMYLEHCLSLKVREINPFLVFLVICLTFGLCPRTKPGERRFDDPEYCFIFRVLDMKLLFIPLGT
jgi:hypothetical protein